VYDWFAGWAKRASKRQGGGGTTAKAALSLLVLASSAGFVVVLLLLSFFVVVFRVCGEREFFVSRKPFDCKLKSTPVWTKKC